MFGRGFYYLRHGETDYNVQKILQGHSDIPLNAKGREQAHLAAQILARHPIDRIITSPLVRAAETAEIINGVLQKPIIHDDRLKERSFGLLEGMNAAQVTQWEQDNQYLETPIELETGFRPPPEGEAYAVFEKRVTDVVTDYLNRYPDEELLFVAHGRVFATVHYTLFSRDIFSQNAHPYYFNQTEGQWRLDCLVTQQQGYN
jgi:broad specificity phosphatase PhoE